MSKYRSPRLSRAQAERLLDTGAGGPEALSALISAAVPPTAAGELAGEHAALMDFRAAHLANVPSRRRIRMLKTAFANLLAAKVAAAAAVAAAATGGVALAAATGHLPGPLQDAAHSAVGAPAAHPAASTTDSDEPSESPSASATASASASVSESAEPSGSAAPSPSLTGLCKAFQAGATSNPGKALSNPAFSVLVATAGGSDKVASYCTTLVGPAATHGAPATHGAASTHAAAHRQHPTHPAGAPVSLPTPTALPTHP